MGINSTFTETNLQNTLSNEMMKRKFYIIGLLLLIGSVSASAQSKNKVHLGLTANPNITWMATSNDGYESDGVKAGITYGLVTDFRLFGEDNYSLTTGFTFSHLGGKISSPDVYSDNGNLVSAVRNSNYSLTNIDVPLAIRLKTNEIGYNVFYGVFGSEVGFNVNANETYTLTYGNGIVTPEDDLDVSDNINLIRTSLVIGLGLERAISGETHYRIGVTFHNGLTNIFKDNTYLVDANGKTDLSTGAPQEDRVNSTKLKFLELNLTIVF